jgi:hypothetical protein
MAKLISAREPSLLGMLRAYLDRRARDDREKHHQKKDED